MPCSLHSAASEVITGHPPPTHTLLSVPDTLHAGVQIQIGRDSGPFGMVDTIDITAMLRMTTAWLRFEPVLLDSEYILGADATMTGTF